MPMPGMMNKVPAPSVPATAAVNRPAISASAVSTSNNVRPPSAVSQFNNNFAANGNRPTVTATAAVSTSSNNGRPQVSPVVDAGASSFHQTSSQAHQQPSQHYLPPTPVQTSRSVIQPAAPAYQPPAPAFQPTPAQALRPAPVQQPSRPVYQPPPSPPAFQGSQTQQQTK